MMLYEQESGISLLGAVKNRTKLWCWSDVVISITCSQHRLPSSIARQGFLANAAADAYIQDSEGPGLREVLEGLPNFSPEPMGFDSLHGKPTWLYSPSRMYVVRIDAILVSSVSIHSSMLFERILPVGYQSHRS